MTIGVIYPGGEPLIRTQSGSARSCFSRRRSEPSFLTGSAFWPGFRPPMHSRRLRSLTCSPPGAGWVTTHAHETYTAPRRLSSPSTTEGSRPPWTGYAACRALGDIPLERWHRLLSENRRPRWMGMYRVSYPEFSWWRARLETGTANVSDGSWPRHWPPGRRSESSANGARRNRLSLASAHMPALSSAPGLRSAPVGEDRTDSSKPGTPNSAHASVRSCALAPRGTLSSGSTPEQRVVWRVVGAAFD